MLLQKYSTSRRSYLPVVSNFICRNLDNEILTFTSSNKLTYTRYADDITISTNQKVIPSNIGQIVDNKLVLAQELINIINNNGFIINDKKTRYAENVNRKEVNGLIVNKKVNVNRKYIRHVRAMLHSWEKFGVALAAQEHFSKYNKKHKHIGIPTISFQNELVGKIGFVGYIKGKDDSVYKNLLKGLKVLAPEVNLGLIQSAIEKESNLVVLGEGQSDWRHLKKAFEKLKQKGLHTDLHLNFHQYEEYIEINNEQLLDMCKSLSKTNFSNHKIICLFDRDQKKYNTKVVENGNHFKHWGRNVYSLLMPVPPHRNFDEICIEFYYTDDDLKKVDSNDRRMYLSTEFDKTNGLHISDSVRYKNPSYLKAAYPRILDSGVLNKDNVNVALSKVRFANYVLEETAPFNDIEFKNFKLIFDEIQKILNL